MSFLPGEPGRFGQADGFRDEPEDERSRRREAFEAAAAATGDTHAMLWHSLFALQQAADSKDWDGLRRRLAEGSTDVPLHAFSLAAFGKAAAAGKLDIVETMTRLGFRLPPGDSEDALAWLATRHAGAALPVVSFMIREQLAAPGPAMLAVAAEGGPAAMETFRRAGCDIHAGDSFSAALYHGNTAIMDYLAAQGADLCSGATVKGLYGGVREYQEANKDSVLSFDAAATLRACRRLLAADRQKSRDYYAEVAVDNPTLADFRKSAGGEMTLMYAASRAGRFSDVIAAAAKETENPLTAGDLLQGQGKGSSVLSVLAAYGEAALAFDARAWYRSPDGIGPLRQALQGLGAADAFDAAGFAADVQRCRLRERGLDRPPPRLRRDR